MNKQEYQQIELRRFQSQNARYFDSVKEFDENLTDMDIDEQIKWIENGSYGAGACFELQRVNSTITKRMNANAHIGNVVLKALYGADFRHWNKLSKNNQDRLNTAIEKWLKSEHDFALKLEV
jgi:threonine dehydrogenase-like Zn-dependent dehydrogenase